MNELLFIVYSCIVSITALIALYLGKEALCAYIAVQAVLANVFVLKQITLFGWQATASDVLIIGSVLGLNVLQEYFGRSAAMRAIWISFLLLVFYTIVSQFQIFFIPAASDTMHVHFQMLLQHMPRITIASLATYLIVQHVDAFLYGAIKKKWQGRFLVGRNYLSIAVSQLLDTILFGFLGLYGLVDSLGQILVVSYCIKLAAIMLAGPFIALSKKIIVKEY